MKEETVRAKFNFQKDHEKQVGNWFVFCVSISPLVFFCFLYCKLAINNFFSLVGIGFTTDGKQIQQPNIKIIQNHFY